MSSICIINFHVQDHPTYKLIIAANRDECLERPTDPARFWSDQPDLLAGRDLRAMGTWMGITKTGRFAALTNFRNPKLESSNKLSRGEIVTNYLINEQPAPAFSQKLELKSNHYNGFNLLAGTVDQLHDYSNQQNKIIPIPSGTHSVSNHLLNTPWPKVMNAKMLLNEYVHNNEQINPDKLFAILNNREIASDETLPETGVSLEVERQLSAVFIELPDYGTRSSTVILVSHDNEVTFIERTFHQGMEAVEHKYNFTIEKPLVN